MNVIETCLYLRVWREIITHGILDPWPGEPGAREEVNVLGGVEANPLEIRSQLVFAVVVPEVNLMIC